VVLHGGIFLGKWRSSFAGNSGGKMNVQSACALNTYTPLCFNIYLLVYVFGQGDCKWWILGSIWVE
jgi:hypothetical protein